MDSDPGTRETPNMSSVCTFRFAERCVLFLCGVRCLLSAAVENVFFPCGVRVSTFFAFVSMLRWSFFFLRGSSLLPRPSITSCTGTVHACPKSDKCSVALS